MSAPRNMDESHPYCRAHGFSTCYVCLHSINVGRDGTIPDYPLEHKYIETVQHKHIVEPKFEKMRVSIADRGYQDGIHPNSRDDKAKKLPIAINNGARYYECEKCRLRYLAGGGPGSYGAHPSHVWPDNQRYVTAVGRAIKFARTLLGIECLANFDFGYNSPMNVNYKCTVKPDEGTVDWNLDNAELATLTRLLHHVADKVVPYRKQLVNGHVRTNSEHFALQARRFHLVLCTFLDPYILDLISRAQTLKYSTKKKAYYENNRFGVAKRKWAATEERRYWISNFIQMIKKLAAEGIQVSWLYTRSDTSDAARRAFREQPFAISQSIPENYHPSSPAPVESKEEELDEGMVRGDALPSKAVHHEQDVEYTPGVEDNIEIQRALLERFGITEEE
ncbi:hypothetical protein F5Y11DRAFT_363473 [Daldinia sp. FL1419]|nr:hypothetical protein F5Y11DRAFT_363473 [Daldinia sp. FL1419]